MKILNATETTNFERNKYLNIVFDSQILIIMSPWELIYWYYYKLHYYLSNNSFRVVLKSIAKVSHSIEYLIYS